MFTACVTRARTLVSLTDIQNILVKCLQVHLTKCIHLREVPEVARKGPHLGDQKTLNPKHLIGALGTKHPVDDPTCPEGPEDKNRNVRSGLSVKKQVLPCITCNRTIQFTLFLSRISQRLSCSGGSNKLYHFKYVCFCQMDLWNRSLSICF